MTHSKDKNNYIPLCSVADNSCFGSNGQLDPVVIIKKLCSHFTGYNIDPEIELELYLIWSNPVGLNTFYY